MPVRTVVKALLDTLFPDIPTQRRSSKMINTTFTSINTAYSDELDALAALVAAKLTIPAGTTAQYLRGDGTLATLPVIDLSTAAKRANFEALAVLAAHGRTNAAINSPTNSKTDYNPVTSLLGTITTGLNDTNTAQNTIATNLNALAVQFNALLTWLGTNKDAINNTRLAGAAA